MGAAKVVCGLVYQKHVTSIEICLLPTFRDPSEKVNNGSGGSAEAKRNSLKSLSGEGVGLMKVGSELPRSSYEFALEDMKESWRGRSTSCRKMSPANVNRWNEGSRSRRMS